MHTGCIGETRPATYRTSRGQYRGKTSGNARRHPRVYRGFPRGGGILECAKLVDAFAALNYSKHKLIDSASVESFLNSKGLLVPVTTEALIESRDHALLPIGKSKAVITRQLL